MAITIIGTVAFDGIETPKGTHDRLLGGSGSYAATAASLFTDAAIISIIGADFPKDYLDYFQSRKINIDGISKSKTSTFYWRGYYEKDMNQAFTKETQLNCLLEFNPQIPDSAKNNRILFLANVDPVLQKKAIEQSPNTKLVVLDTMNFWIQTKLDALKEVIRLTDVLIINDQEIRQLTGIDNIIAAMPQLLQWGPKLLIVKKGEHGAILYDGTHYFAIPAIPVVDVVDPTGAGDSFAGGFVGYLDSEPDFSIEAFKKAMVIGTLVASYTVQGFGLSRLKTITISDLQTQLTQLTDMTQLPSGIIE